MDQEATNYNHEVTTDDGTCQYPVGSSDPTAPSDDGAEPAESSDPAPEGEPGPEPEV